MVLGVGKGVLFREVSSVQECPQRERLHCTYSNTHELQALPLLSLTATNRCFLMLFCAWSPSVFLSFSFTLYPLCSLARSSLATHTHKPHTTHARIVVSRARRNFSACTHARMRSGRGKGEEKYVCRHPAKYARNVFRGLRCTCAATLSHKNKLQSSSKQIWSNALERTNHHDDTLPLAPV